MSGLSRFFNYVKTWFSVNAEKRMDPAIQIEQAVADARKQDSELRNQAARVIAHRSEIQMKLDRAIEESATAKGQASEALRRADSATQAGNTTDVGKWTRTAQSIAMKLESSETLVTSLKGQYETATQQAELAKTQVSDNALKVEQLTAKRMELMGKLEQAKMQEQVNKTLENLHRPLDTAAPSIREIEDKINARMAQASGHAELEAGSLEGAQAELERDLRHTSASARLDALRSELGLSEPATPEAIPAPPADHPG